MLFEPIFLTFYSKLKPPWFYHTCVSKLIPPPKDGKPLRMIAGKYEWSGAREVGDCSVRIVQADINYDDGELDALQNF